jgi:hypothetical protein
MSSQRSVHQIIISKTSFKILDDNEITLIVSNSSEYWPGKAKQHNFYIKRLNNAGTPPLPTLYI